MNIKFVYLIAILSSLHVIDAHACSCSNLSDKQRYLDASDIFLGTVVETKLLTKAEQLDDQITSNDQVQAKIRILKGIKGKSSVHLGQHIDLLDSVANGANCAIGLFTGRQYLFYLNGSKVLSLCDGTRLYNEFADQELIQEMLSY